MDGSRMERERKAQTLAALPGENGLCRKGSGPCVRGSGRLSVRQAFAANLEAEMSHATTRRARGVRRPRDALGGPSVRRAGERGAREVMRLADAVIEIPMRASNTNARHGQVNQCGHRGRRRFLMRFPRGRCREIDRDPSYRPSHEIRLRNAGRDIEALGVRLSQPSSKPDD
jgi:hypothetical protein